MSTDSLSHFEDLPDILTAEESATFLHLHVKTVLSYIKDGRIRAVRCGKYYRIRKQWITDFLNRESR